MPLELGGILGGGGALCLLSVTSNLFAYEVLLLVIQLAMLGLWYSCEHLSDNARVNYNLQFSRASLIFHTSRCRL